MMGQPVWWDMAGGNIGEMHIGIISGLSVDFLMGQAVCCGDMGQGWRGRWGASCGAIAGTNDGANCVVGQGKAH